ncbi:DeoR/GlpR family DNA-binding transcription regulator [Rubellicoccus peritrichatus]|uniref:DeoR/GlpR family DNA-binding transcription regulator n=1 Tax=Rubellicoccus peritrichatus TaxID=3080537 RepID=A0AAQ3QW70_9BACT|nr:DeoR/GlpR family DNA-binding transcription regulator [Puniceicoccus sp. CR14]WOO41610.1 DeoR/GlpR family DNA-binding transcription regulator [Puniceicoccus sp. CR14]
MTNKQRLDLIEKFIREHKYADLHTLAQKFDISLSTVRRALNDLETNGIVRRHHGGASLVEDEASTGGYDFITQDDRQSDEKHLIAQSLCELIEPGMTVLIDGGTTTYAAARQLVEKRLIIITNSLPIAALYSEVGSCETIVTGGTVYNRLGILYGPACEKAISHVHADVAICGSAGITANGIWNNNSFIISTQQRMMESADKTYFAIDATKHNRRVLHQSCELSDRFTLITDAPPPKDLREALDEAGTPVIIAEAIPNRDSEPEKDPS